MWSRLWAGGGGGVDLMTAVHKFLCTIWNRKQEKNIAARGC
jgi:hypothetical protein